MLPITVAVAISIIVTILAKSLSSWVGFEFYKIFEFPWSFSLLVIPVTFSTHLWFKLSDLSSTQVLSSQQHQNLCEIIKVKLCVVKFSILFYLLTAFLSVSISSMGKTVDPWFLGIALGTIMASVFLFFSIACGLSEVSDFKMELDQKAISDKSRKEALEKLGKDKTDFKSDDLLDSYNKITSL